MSDLPARPIESPPRSPGRGIEVLLLILAVGVTAVLVLSSLEHWQKALLAIGGSLLIVPALMIVRAGRVAPAPGSPWDRLQRGRGKLLLPFWMGAWWTVDAGIADGVLLFCCAAVLVLLDPFARLALRRLFRARR